MASSEKVTAYGRTYRWILTLAALGGLLFALGGCRLLIPEAPSLPGPGLGSISVRVQAVSPVIANLLSESGAGRAVASRAYIVARKVDFEVALASDLHVVDSWTDFPSTFSGGDSPPEIGARTLPAGDYILSAEVYNNPADPSPSVVGSEPFTVVQGEAPEDNLVVVTCVPVSPVQLSLEGEESGEYTIPVPWNFDFIAYLYSLGSEMWFEIVPTTAATRIILTPAEGSVAMPVMVVFSETGAFVVDAYSGDALGDPLQLDLASVAWSHYYIGVIDLASPEASPRSFTLQYAPRPTGNQPPVVRAYGASTVQANSWEPLSSDASDPDVGQTLTYLWEIVAGPSQIGLGDPSLESTTFTPETLGTYTVALTATDNGDPALSTTDTITIMAVPNQPPDLQLYDVSMTLHTSRRISVYAHDGQQTLTYHSEITSGPVLSGLTEVDENDPKFTPEAEGIYTMTVTVTDDQAPPLSTTASLTVTVAVPVPAPIGVTGTFVEYTISDERWYSFDAVAGSSYEVSWADAFDGPDTYDALVTVSAYDEAFGVLFPDRVQGYSFPQTIGPMVADQAIYLRVASYFMSGTFALKVTDVTP